MSVPTNQPPPPAYPPPPKRTPWGLLLGLGCGIPTVLIVGCIAVTVNSRTFQRMRTNTAPPLVRYDPSTFKMTRSASGMDITGSVTNKTDQPIRFLKVRFDILDKNGVRVHRSIDSTRKFQPKATWNFDVKVNDKRAVSYKFLEVSNAPLDFGPGPQPTSLTPKRP